MDSSGQSRSTCSTIPNFFNPLLNRGVQFGTSTFGTITQANNPRDLQFSLLRILF